MNGEMREKLDRMMPDVINGNAERYASRRFKRKVIH
jgi:hypothetical protein